MKAVVKYAEGEGNIELKEVPEPDVGDNEVKIKVEAAGICGSPADHDPASRCGNGQLRSNPGHAQPAI